MAAEQAETGGSWLTGILQSDVTVLRLAGEQYAADTDAQTAALAARRSLDRQLQVMAGWPRTEDYEQMAADYEAAGRAGEAALLRQVAATGELQAEARARWNHRYTGHLAGATSEMIASMAEGGMIDFDPDGPYRGIDGASYRPGMLTIGRHDHPIVVIATRAGAELAVDWADYAAMSAWIAQRGSTTSGPLEPPPTPSGRAIRSWREEQVLARMLEEPGELPALATDLPPDTFTADVRYDIYAAILALNSRGLRPGPDRVAAELDRRLAWLPDHALPVYGGPAGRTAQAYLSRMAATPVSYVDAVRSARALSDQDAQSWERGPMRSLDHAEDLGPRPRKVPEQMSWLALGGQAVADDRAPAVAPVRTSEEPPPPGPASPLDPGLRPPDQPRPGGPSIWW